ncbi:MAG: glycosyl transferase family 1 [Actinobacteria bacterium HGW-Actinobacteria-5]|nr:MAG: glycosyl transferase family 1 [Actinobacteria bacterium HGW-Actinobacteria-5]
MVAGRVPPRGSGRRRRPGWSDEAESSPDTVLVAHPSAELYGSDRVMLESISGLVATGRRVVLTLPGPGPLVDAARERGAEVRFCPTPVLRKAALRPLGFLHLLAQTLGAVGRGRRLIRKEGIGLVLVNTLTIPLWLALARSCGVPSVCHVHEAEASQPWYIRRLLYAPLALADRLLVNSRFSTETLASAWPRLERRATVLYNGVPGPVTAPAAPRADLGGGPRLLFIGRLSPRKGPQVAVDALADLVRSGVPATLVLLGAVFDGYEWFEEQLHEQVERLGLGDRVEFAGFDPDVWRYFADSDIVLVPSTVDEPFGNTAVEAMLAERPLVVSRTSGLKEASDGFESARLVEPGDSAAIAEAVQGLIEDWPAVCEQVARDRLSAVARYAPEVYQQRLGEILGLRRG